MNNPVVSMADLEVMIANSDFHCHFQPIFDVRQENAIGYEALVRCNSKSLFSSPVELFDCAFEYGLLAELEASCRRLAIREFTALGLPGLLFLNVSPLAIEKSTCKSSEMPEILLECGLSPERIVIEITERYEASNIESLKMGLNRYRELGFKIAIDDLGTGYSGLKQWAEVSPDIVKIDRYFITECHNNIVKRELIRTLFDLGKATDVTVIAEGIETDEEYLFLRKLGMTYAQGYLLGKPQQQPVQQLHSDLWSGTLTLGDNPNIVESELGKLLLDVTPIDADMACEKVYRLFKSHANSLSFAIVDENQFPIGMIYRDELVELLSSQFGHALYDKRPISNVMKPVNLLVEYTTSIDEASQFITDNTEFDLHPEFVVIHNNKYAGLVNVRSILKRMTEEKIRHAQQANPLTMLPGNNVIDQKIAAKLQRKQSFQMAYFDLNNFKPFNDVYGYSAGDQVIKLVADIIGEYCTDSFVGHVGGDDFVVLFSGCDAMAFCQRVVEIFEKRILNYFEPQHIQSNGYFSTDREGNHKLIPLLGLSCGIISPDVEQMNSIHDVSLLASKAKKMAKKTERGKVYMLHNSQQRLTA